MAQEEKHPYVPLQPPPQVKKYFFLIQTCFLAYLEFNVMHALRDTKWPLLQLNLIHTLFHHHHSLSIPNLLPTTQMLTNLKTIHLRQGPL